MSFLDQLVGGGGESTSRSFIYGPQEQYLQDIMRKSQDLYNSGQSPVADMSPELQQYIQQAMGFGDTSGNLFDASYDAANDSWQVGSAGGNYMMDVLNSGGFQAPTQTGVNMDTVNSLIDNDMLDQQITASTRDIYRDLNENQMPGIATGAASSGNAGSTRRGVAEGIAMRGADDRASDVAAGIRSNAYNQAVGVAANQAAANQGAQLTTNNLNANTATNAFGTGGNMFNTGVNTAFNVGAGGINTMGQGANAMQSYMQQVAMAPWQKLQLYQGGVGSPIQLSESTNAGTGNIGNYGQLFQGISNFAGAFTG